MKSLAILSLCLIATAAMADQDNRYSSSSKIEIDGPSVQVTVLNRSGVLNMATGGGKASQNLASNAGNVSIDNGGSSLQIVAASGTGIMNVANGWGAVAVNGFIPPRAFQEFQALGIMTIAADIRSSNHLAYTPAPDIVHESAGHAPLIPDAPYAPYLRPFGGVGARATRWSQCVVS